MLADTPLSRAGSLPHLFAQLEKQSLTIRLDDKHYHSLEMDQVPP
jgi:hypothetical protein